MKIKRIILFLLLGFLSTSSILADEKLTGSIIGTELSYDYSTNSSSTTVNTIADAFDGDPNTFFAGFGRSYSWAGLDLGSPHIITKVGWMPRNYPTGPQNVVLGMFEGANREDFMDAVPLYMITSTGDALIMSYDNVQCGKGFRYVRYVGPSNSRCTIAELEFYGHAGTGTNTNFYRMTNLPVVTIHTLDGEIPIDKVTPIVAQLTILDDNGHVALLTGPGNIRERGNGSLAFPKRPYRIKFDSKKQVLGSPAKAKKWTLIPNYGDKTLMRNMLAFELSRLLGMPYTPFCTPVDVILNGEYKGCYQLCDQVEVNNNRVSVTEMTPADISGASLTGGYLFEIDAYADEETSWFTSQGGNDVTIKSPDDDEITPEQSQYIENHFNLMEANKKEYLDMNTFLRYFIVGELSGNTDTFWCTFMYKQRDDDIIYTGPVWDYDLAFENDIRTYPINDNDDYIYRTTGSYSGNMRNFVDELIVDDPEVQQQLKGIWCNARRNGLTASAMIAYLDSLEVLLDQAQTLNFMRWKIMDQAVQQNPVVWGSYSAEVENVRRFIRERFEWMDSKLEYPGDVLPGDANGDGIVSINDITTLIDYLLGNVDEINDGADFDEDGVIGINDLTSIIDFLLSYH